MNSNFFLIFIGEAIVSVAVTVFVVRYFFSRSLKKQEAEAEQKAEAILKNAEEKAENLKNQKILEAKEFSLKRRAEADEDLNRRKQTVVQSEQRIKENERQLQQQREQVKRTEDETTRLRQSLAQQQENARRKEENADAKLSEATGQLERLAGLSADEARQLLMDNLTAEAESRASSLIKNTIEEAKLTATKEAKKIVIETIQRTAAEHAIENTVSVFNIESEDVKGKIIGREGRNIRTLESACGVEVIVDDTPDAIVISGFDPVRREIARLSLHRLVQDGRIHPARIEEVVAKTKKNIEDEIVEIGERTAIDLGIHGLHPELIKMVGRMRFRSSYGQNLLQHSREVAKLCATMAAELGLNAKLAKRAGLLHDIGKVWHEEPEQPHALLGMDLAVKYKENPEVCNAIGAHHDEIEMTSLISPIIQVCDAISGSRPGARREMMESYIQRLKDLEALATGFNGVNKCYAIQAGRELRVIVDSDRINDEKASQLSYDISQKIEKEMQYPGQIKITVIREMRAVSIAK